jgi:hypothetical protein
MCGRSPSLTLSKSGEKKVAMLDEIVLVLGV